MYQPGPIKTYSAVRKFQDFFFLTFYHYLIRFIWKVLLVWTVLPFHPPWLWCHQLWTQTVDCGFRFLCSHVLFVWTGTVGGRTFLGLLGHPGHGHPWAALVMFLTVCSGLVSCWKVNVQPSEIQRALNQDFIRYFALFFFPLTLTGSLSQQGNLHQTWCCHHHHHN